jgi:periplasmic protein TonB
LMRSKRQPFQIPIVDNIDVVGQGDGGAGVVEAPAEEIFVTVEQMPENPYNIQEFLAKNIKYPGPATRNEIQGIVYVNFVVGPDGKISQAAVMKGIGYGCDEEALRVVSKMPDWTPGKQGGRAVPVRISLPIRFKLN